MMTYPFFNVTISHGNFLMYFPIRSSISGEFCGDGKCDPMSENSTNCPLDCCAEENPSQCQITNNTCTDLCCMEEYCCNVPKDNNTSDSGLGIILWVVLGVVGGIILLNICCCCACICCARRCCKKHKKQKFDERHPPENRDVKRLKQYKKSHSSPV